MDDYSAARATPLSRGEREQIAACATFIAAYTARCEHSRDADAVTDATRFAAALHEHGLSYLAA